MLRSYDRNRKQPGLTEHEVGDHDAGDTSEQNSLVSAVGEVAVCVGVNEHQQNRIEQAQELLTTIVQLGNREEIEQLKNRLIVCHEI